MKKLDKWSLLTKKVDWPKKLIAKEKSIDIESKFMKEAVGQR